MDNQKKLYWLGRAKEKVYQSAAAGSEQLADCEQFLVHSEQIDNSVLDLFKGIRDAYAVLASFLELNIQKGTPYTPKKAGVKLPSFDPGKIIHGTPDGIEVVGKEQNDGK